MADTTEQPTATTSDEGGSGLYLLLAIVVLTWGAAAFVAYDQLRQFNDGLANEAEALLSSIVALIVALGVTGSAVVGLLVKVADRTHSPE